MWSWYGLLKWNQKWLRSCYDYAFSTECAVDLVISANWVNYCGCVWDITGYSVSLPPTLQLQPLSHYMLPHFSRATQGKCLKIILLCKPAVGSGKVHRDFPPSFWLAVASSLRVFLHSHQLSLVFCSLLCLSSLSASHWRWVKGSVQCCSIFMFMF